jgi:hypothetical protein
LFVDLGGIPFLHVFELQFVVLNLVFLIGYYLAELKYVVRHAGLLSIKELGID